MSGANIRLLHVHVFMNKHVIFVIRFIEFLNQQKLFYSNEDHVKIQWMQLILLRTNLVTYGAGNSDVSIHTDGTEAKYWGCTTEHVSGSPDITERAAEYPLLTNLEGRGERQHQESEQQVSDSEADDEVVSGRAQLPVHNDRQ